jgi:hypothetical protein
MLTGDVRMAIVWKNFQQTYVLKGHEAAVWSVLSIDNERILTGQSSLDSSLDYT